MICDLAETYHILNYKELPVETLAILVIGLRENSRVKMKFNKIQIPLNERLLAYCLDALNLSNWLKSKDGSKNINRPKPILSILENNKKDNEVRGFESKEEFEKIKNEIIRKVVK